MHMQLADLTWEEVRQYLQEKESLIIPVSICEQHSRHLPLKTDTVVTEYIAAYLSENTGILIAPTVNYGVGLPCDKVYAGTTSITYEALHQTLTALISGWRDQGFRQFFILSAHGDPVHLKALHDLPFPQVNVLEIYDVKLDDILERQTTTKHACEAETSVMLYLFPETVRTAQIEDFETPWAEFQPYLQHLKTDPIPNSPGGQGYPSFATPAKGEQIVARMKARALQWLKEHRELCEEHEYSY